MDPKNVEALVALAIIDMNTNEGRFHYGFLSFAWKLFFLCHIFPYIRVIQLRCISTMAASRIRNGMEKMQKAFEIYPSCAMAPNYLANHFFFTGQRFLVEQLTETAFAIADHGPTKSHSFYNLAQSYHSKV